MAINALIKPRKTSPDTSIITFDVNDLVLALQKIDDSKRKVLIGGLWYDLRTIDIETSFERGPEEINITMRQYGNDGRFDVEAISTETFLAIVSELRKSKALFPIIDSHFDLRTLTLEIPT